MSAAVGKKLRQAREALGLTLEQVAQETHIRLHYLRAMEAGQFDAMPSRVQARGFLRSYAGHLRIDVEPLFEAWEGDALLTFMPPEEQAESDAEGAPDADATAGAKADADEPAAVEETATGLAAVGETLRTQRELLGLSREDVERHTHLRIHYLQVLERGDMEALPSAVQGTGMLKNYAEFLGLDPEPLLLRFAEDLQSQLFERRRQGTHRSRVTREPQKKLSMSRRFFSRDILIGGSIVIFLIVFALWAGMRIATARSAEEPEPTPPSIADVLLPSSTASIEPTATATIPSPLDEAADADADAAAGGPAVVVIEDPFALEDAERLIRIQIVIHQRAYMRITVDGEVEFDGRVIPGAAYAFAGDAGVEILTGNAAGLHVTYNEVELGVLGFYGEVVNFVITADGIQTPTPTISPTATETPQATLTPTRTPVP
ncbi:MAG: DUF4115 domain-containing protein [Anaerolineales bacterium]|nr:DUF4115 domain-containing protein [Anaerolineales bacterium]